MENYPKAVDVILHAWLAHRWWYLVGLTWSILTTCNTFPCSNADKLSTDKNMPPRKQDTKLSNWKNKCSHTLCKRWTRTSLNMTLISSFIQVNIRSQLLWDLIQIHSNKNHFISTTVSSTHIPQTHNERHLPYLYKILTLVCCLSRCSISLWSRTCWSCQKIVNSKDFTSC